MTGHTEPALFDLDPAPAPAAQVPAQRSPVEKDVEAILAALWADQALAGDRAAVVWAIVLEARAHQGDVDPNSVRSRLAGDDGRPAVKPQLVGAVYRHLAAKGVLVAAGHIRSTDKASGNAGRLIPAYRLERIPEEAA